MACRLASAIIWTNAGILLIGPFRTNFSESLIEIYAFLLKKIHLKMLYGKCRPFCLGFNVLMLQDLADKKSKLVQVVQG